MKENSLVSCKLSTLTNRELVRLLRKLCPNVIYALIANYFIGQTTLRRGEDRGGHMYFDFFLKKVVNSVS